MPTTLESTGVRFPDNSLQTTAGGLSSFNGNTGAVNGWQNIASGTFSATTAVNITGLASGYRAIQLIFQFTASGTTNLGFRYSTNNGSSYIATSTYQWSTINNFGSTLQNGTTETATSVALYDSNPSISASSRQNINFIFNQGDGTRTAGGTLQSSILNLGTGTNGATWTNFNLGTATYINAFQIVRTSGTGTATGLYTVLGTK